MKQASVHHFYVQLLFQPLPDHGVYTVFVKLDNTKLEVRCLT